MTKVHSKEIKAPAKSSDGEIAVAIAGLMIGALLWIIGARFTIDGLFWVGNVILGFVRAPIRIPTPPIWIVYIALLPVPLLCSRVEWTVPFTRANGKWRITGAKDLLVWVVIAIIDSATTYAGVVQPPSDAWQMLRELASSVILSIAVSIVLTFLPEWLIRVCWRQLWE